MMSVGETENTTEVLTSAGRPVYGVDTHLSATNPTERWTRKANAFATAWFQKYGQIASKWAVVEGCSVAQHETMCGDAWPNEFNWGAVQLRGLTLGEKAVLGSLVTSPTNVAAARALLAQEAAAHVIPDEPNGALHVDSSPGKGWYWVYFHKFPNDVAGAKFFIHVLCDQRPVCRTVLLTARGVWSSELSSLAANMYATHYYEGFYIPTKMYGDKTGAAMNVLAYAGSLQAIAPAIAGAIGAWVPKLDINLLGFGDVQAALTLLAWDTVLPIGVIAAVDPGVIDGVWGPNSKAGLAAFQKGQNLEPSGMPNAPTALALQVAVDSVIARLTA